MLDMAQTPLWPAGHLPLKGGDRQLRQRRHLCEVDDCGPNETRLISPLEGEMAGRPEGGQLEPSELAGVAR